MLGLMMNTSRLRAKRTLETTSAIQAVFDSESAKSMAKAAGASDKAMARHERDEWAMNARAQAENYLNRGC